MTVEINIPNLKNFERGLQSFPKKLAKKILNLALKKGAQVLSEAIKKEVPVRLGALKESIDDKGKKVSDVEQIHIVGSYNKPGSKQPTNYAHLVEYGHKWVVMRGKKVIAAGTKAPQPYMRPAFDTSKDEIQNVIAETIGAAAAKEWKKVTNG